MPRGGRRPGAGRPKGSRNQVRCDTDTLTAKQRRFVAEYSIDLNATQAAIRAGYSAKSAQQLGYQLLQKTSVAAAIAAEKARQLKAADLSAVRVLEEHRRISFSDIRHYLDEHGRIKPLHTLAPELTAALASIKVTKKNLTVGDGQQEDVIELKLWDKLQALEALARHFGLLTEKVHVTGELSLLEKVNRARQRVAALRRGELSDDEPPESSKR
jgi:phage terminase small subunit